MKEYACKIVMLDEDDGLHVIFDDGDNGSIEVFEAIKKTVGKEELPDGLHLTEGLMNNIWLQKKAYEFWSDEICNFVHETEPGKRADQVFKFVIGEDEKLVISPQAKVVEKEA